jgi:hypothetical protein
MARRVLRDIMENFMMRLVKNVELLNVADNLR